MRAVRVRAGVMSARMVCLGRRWTPSGYVGRSEDGHSVKPFPDWLGDLARSALVGAGFDGPYEPDIAVITFYDAAARMGMHQDRDERSPAPVVSISLGDTGVFRLGNPQTRSRPWIDVPLESGDLFVFGGPSRLAYHGVPQVRPGTGPDIGLAGRLNITLRESGL